MNGRDARGQPRAGNHRAPRLGAPGALAAFVLMAALGAAAWIGAKPSPPPPRVVLAFNPTIEARIETATAPTATPKTAPEAVATDAAPSEPLGEAPPEDVATAAPTPEAGADLASNLAPDLAEASLADATLAETGLASAAPEPTIEREVIEAPPLPAVPQPATAGAPLAGAAPASVPAAPETSTTTAEIPPPPAVDGETGRVFARAPEPLPEPAPGIADAVAPAEPVAAPAPVVATAPAAAPPPIASDTPPSLAPVEAKTPSLPAPTPRPATAEAPAAAPENEKAATPWAAPKIVAAAIEPTAQSAPPPAPAPATEPARAEIAAEAPVADAVESEAPPAPRPMPTAVAASRIPAPGKGSDETTPTPEPDAPAGLALLPEAAVAEPGIAPAPILVPETAATPPEAAPPPATPTTKPTAPRKLAFAKPFPKPTSTPEKAAKARPMIAVVLTRLGLGPAATAAALRLPSGVTLAFASYARDLQAQIDRARASGHEVLLDLPMEPMRYPAIDPGPRALLVSLSSVEILDRLDWHLGRATGYTGVTHDMGSRFTASRDALRPVLAAIKARGLYFLDSRTSSRSQGVKLASAMGLRFAANDRFLDAQASREAIEGRLAEIERIARRRGFAVAVGHPFRSCSTASPPGCRRSRKRG